MLKHELECPHCGQSPPLSHVSSIIQVGVDRHWWQPRLHCFHVVFFLKHQNSQPQVRGSSACVAAFHHPSFWSRVGFSHSHLEVLILGTLSLSGGPWQVHTGQQAIQTWSPGNIPTVSLPWTQLGALSHRAGCSQYDLHDSLKSLFRITFQRCSECTMTGLLWLWHLQPQCYAERMHSSDGAVMPSPRRPTGLQEGLSHVHSFPSWGPRGLAFPGSSSPPFCSLRLCAGGFEWPGSCQVPWGP